MGKGKGRMEKDTKRKENEASEASRLKGPQGAPGIYPALEPGQDPITCLQGIGANRSLYTHRLSVGSLCL